jgi:phenylpropionate dioxygenase-like ring-hydroxylating dioxygenase large terminal subunit
LTAGITASAVVPGLAPPAISVASFWYVVADSHELPRGAVLPRTVLGLPLAVFRDSDGRPVALEDRCAHRASPLSAGRVEDGRLRCGYHGWRYDGRGHVVEIPSLGPGAPPRGCTVRAYPTCERDGYVYVRPSKDDRPGLAPFAMPHSGAPGFGHVRLVNRFRASVTRCVQNFVDIPHTAYVHAGLFRSPRAQRLSATVERRGGSVLVRYAHETANLGIFARFLNRRGAEIEHVDAFHMPNVTCVEYGFGGGRRFVITSQSIPVSPDDTLVYTDLAYAYGVWNTLARPVVRWLAQRVIDQDVAILGRQTDTIRTLGDRTMPAPADSIHAFIDGIQRDLAEGRDPRAHEGAVKEISFWV